MQEQVISDGAWIADEVEGFAYWCIWSVGYWRDYIGCYYIIELSGIFRPTWK
jgi:hypothetical protein